MIIMSKLSQKDFEILEFIKQEQLKKGFPPSVREICDAVGLKSTATIHSRLKKLEMHGVIVRDSSKNRSIKIVGEEEKKVPVYNSDKYIEVPIYGKVTAGIPITAVEDISDTVALPLELAGNKELFILRVSGDSMINAAILDNDYIIVRKQNVADNGDIVVALVDDENATVKTFYKENGYIRLQPENDAYEPIISDNAVILGKVVGVFRKL